MNGCKISHAPVFVACRSRCAPWTAPPFRVSARAYYDHRTLRFHTDILPSWRQAEWSIVRNSSWPLSAATSCPVTTQDVVQFSGAVFVGSGRARPACFTGRRVTPLPNIPSPRPWKRDGIKASHSACSTKPKASLMSGVTRCKNYHSCWNDF